MSGIVLFYDSSFPMSSEGLTEESLKAIGAYARVVDANGLAEALHTAEPGCFVNLHAPYFPKDAWGDIVGFLKRGGGLISAGGAPFKHPVRRSDDGQWHAEAEQTAYHQALGIHEALRVDGGRVTSLTALTEIPLLQGQEELLQGDADAWNLVPHVTKSSDLPHQMGSAGPMDARIYPLLKGRSEDGRELSAPVVLWERVLGEFAGARWLFFGQPLGTAFWQGGGAEALASWIAFTAAGVTEWWLKPDYACYEQGERPLLTLQAQRLGGFAAASDAPNKEWNVTLTIERDGEGGESWEHIFTVEVKRDIEMMRFPVPLALESGYYRATASLTSIDGERRVLRQGFWGRHDALLEEGEPVSADRDYFRKDGRPMPVVGMTYMTSDVARKFLTLPNVSVWDRDMAAMRGAGINWIRTGIWTAYRNIMEVDGHASEAALRAIDAFLLTAKRHDLQVTFTFFSFTPEAWEGLNPYLDPRSVEAQKRFVRSIISRHRNTKNVDWDLINEPSMFDPPRIFSDGPRSCGDVYEREAFSAWLEERHGSIQSLQEKWNMTPQQLPSFAAALPPEPEEINFDVQDMHQAKKGGRWLDYVLFSMEMHNVWAKQLYDAIKEVCPDHMVTVGQDEALGAQRPSPFFYEEAADYTTVHSWWLNDHLLWDGIFSKTANKPNLVQETGIMYVETPDGRAKRSEQELRGILERKYAYAFAAGGAGAIQWIWNTNFYMDNANESHIGAIRADGTEKPEADVSYDFGRFMGEIGDLFEGREIEETAMVFPYSNDFSNRKLAFDATTRAARVLGYRLNVPCRAVGEYHLDDLLERPAKLIIVPSPHNFDSGAFDKLMSIVSETGATLLWTGPIGLNAYWRQESRLADELGRLELRNVRREERLLNVPEGVDTSISFGARRIAETVKETTVEKSGEDRGGDCLSIVPVGAGRLIWCPLPVELNERPEAVEVLYRTALEEAGVGQELNWLEGGDLPGVYGRKLTFASGSLFVFVSESGFDAEVAVQDPVTGSRYRFKLEQERSVLFATDKQGKIKSVYRPAEVTVEHIQ
ncbi:beta-galactosidase [Paenibacillus chungangensis]|uniref:Beta-galactosidase n=1 Tax=Paenibacillus chungangensis TaxID=696535 RepID=A0ABW3HVT6_9BACL